MPERSGDESRPEPWERPWVHPSELPSEPPSPPEERPHRSPARPLAVLVGAVALVGVGALAVGGLGSGGTATTPAGTRLSALPTALDGLPAGSSAAFDGVVARVTAWSGPHVRYGSALVVDDAGLLVTAASTIAGAGAIEIEMRGHEPREADVVGFDDVNDLAVLRVDGSGLRNFPFGEHPVARLDRGDACMVVSADHDGAPRARSTSVAALDAAMHHDGGWMIDAIHLTAPMSTDVAGATVIDPAGDLIGVLAVPGSEPVVVPAGEARRVVRQIVADGVVTRPWLGVLAVDDATGVLVDGVVDGSPAQHAGVAEGDVIVAVGGEAIETVGELVRAVRTHAPGDTVTLHLRRAGTTLELAARLASQP